LLLPVCRAIAHAHQQGIIHRDLKPSNILIDADGQPLVGDFGLAKRIEVKGAADASQAAEALTRTGAILGTPSYMSPEQAAGSRGTVGPASDIYSLGAILYQCLTGRPPFQAASALDVVMMVLEQDPVLPRALNPRADADLEMIALKCLQKPAELRYKSAAALADDLAAYLANEPISARSTNVTQLVSRMLRETHHAGVLENWGLLWIWHSLVLLVLCLVTNWLQWRHVTSRTPYVGLWVIGLGAWAGIFWSLRRRGGPITFVERQIAHVWGASMIASCLLFVVETLLGMPVLTLSPVLPLVGAMVFVIKAGILSGAFYFQAAANFAVAIVMAWIRREDLPDYCLTLYGLVAAASFFIPGVKYYRQRTIRTSRVNKDGGSASN
jgi:serine/threonine-protein kinase